MARLRVPAPAPEGQRDAPLLPAVRPGASPTTTARDLLLHSWPGRLFLVSAALRLLTMLLRPAGSRSGSSKS